MAAPLPKMERKKAGSVKAASKKSFHFGAMVMSSEDREKDKAKQTVFADLLSHLQVAKSGGVKEVRIPLLPS